MAKVFLSYVRDDESSARKIASILERLGHSVWWDRHIRGGAQFSDQIDQALGEAEAVVVLWSKKSASSPWVRDEAAAGRDTGRLVPVLIARCTPPLGFRQFQTIDLTNIRKLGEGSEVAQLDEALRALTSSEPESIRHTMPARTGNERFSRRRILLAGGAASTLAVGGGALFIYNRPKEGAVPREVEPLMLQAKQLMNQNTREGQYQAIGLYQRVVQIAPDYADGWGWLGYAYGVISHYRDRPEALASKARAQAAGRRALELDPKSAFGELALSVALPFIGHWSEREQRLLRALSYRPNDDELLVMLGVLLQFVGRSTQAVPLYQRVKHSPFTPAEYTNYIRALWSAGRLPELDQAINDAASLYPTQATLWYTRLQIAMYSGQFGAVTALVTDARARPSGVSDTQSRDFLALAQALQSRGKAQADAILAKGKDRARLYAVNAENFVRDASAFGRLDDAFQVAEAYYFGRGFIIPDTSSEGSGFSPENRQTRFLFEPVTKPLRADPRFERLVKELGFDRYWRKSGKPPDYRHVSGL